MGNFIKKVKKLIYNLILKKRIIEPELNFEQLVSMGKNPFFHGNNKILNSTIGLNSYVSFNSIVYYTDIGNYCSIGPNVVIGYGDHPMEMISTSPHIYLNDFIFDLNETNEILNQHFKRVQIENDVWIGANVYIKNGVRIGNGSIVGAGSVVVRDVGDYEIVVGVPAKILRKRFNDKIIGLLLESKWWLLNVETLKKYKDVLRNPTELNLKEMIKNEK